MIALKGSMFGRFLAAHVSQATPDPRTQRDAPLWRTLLLLVLYGIGIAVLVWP